MPGSLAVHRALIAGAIAVAAIGCTSTSTAGDQQPRSDTASSDSKPTDSKPGDSGTRSIAAQQTFAMSPGESVALADRGTLRYVGVKSDSRCPPERQCVWAGDAEVTFEWTATGASAQLLDLHTGFADKRSKPVAGHTLTLVSLARGEKPEAQLRLDAGP